MGGKAATGYTYSLPALLLLLSFWVFNTVRHYIILLIIRRLMDPTLLLIPAPSRSRHHPPSIVSQSTCTKRARAMPTYALPKMGTGCTNTIMAMTPAPLARLA